MRPLLIRDLSGTIERLTSYEVTRENNINSEKKLTVNLLKTDANAHAISMVQNLNYFIFENEEYVIQTVENTDEYTLNVTAIHRFFVDMDDQYIYETQTGTFSLTALLTIIFTGSGYSFVVDDTFSSVALENFGDKDRLSLFQDILSEFGCEFSISGTTIAVAAEISRHTGYQFRYKLNVTDLRKKIDASSFKTYIKGFGKQNDDGSYVVTADYTSPLADVFGVKHADPVRDERYTDYDSLLNRLKSELNDKLPITLSLTYIQLESLGIQDIQMGDYVICVIAPFDMSLEIRVVGVQDSADESQSPVYTLGTIQAKATDVIGGMQDTAAVVSKIYDTNTGSINPNALDATVTQTIKTVDDLTTDNGKLDLTKSEGRLPGDQVSIDGNTQFADGYAPPGLASLTSDGLLAKALYKVLNSIPANASGTAQIAFYDGTNQGAGLMSDQFAQDLARIVDRITFGLDASNQPYLDVKFFLNNAAMTYSEGSNSLGTVLSDIAVWVGRLLESDGSGGWRLNPLIDMSATGYDTNSLLGVLHDLDTRLKALEP